MLPPPGSGVPELGRGPGKVNLKRLLLMKTYMGMTERGEPVPELLQ
eukprot:g82766.t1